MKLKLTLFLMLVLGQLLSGQYFNHDKSLRIDFQLTGDKTNTQVFLTQMKEEPHYGGPATKHIMPMYGEFLFQLIEPNTGEILFSKGFNSLYGEWLQSREENEKKLFYHAIQVPFPLKKMKLSMSQRQKNGQFVSIFSKIISPDDYFIKKEKVTPYPIKNILYNGDPHHKVDIVVVAEGYTKEEKEKFYADVQRMADYMFSIPPYNQHKKDFNIYAVASTSLESGTDIPGENTYKNTVFNSSFFTFNIERYLTSNSVGVIADVASLVPYDQIYVLVNTKKYGGAGFYNHLNLASADNALSGEVFIHEFGHAFVGLADEYYTSQVAFDKFYNLETEPWEPNITTLVDFNTKWKSMLDKNTPIPTPRTKEYKNTLGVFEGGGYVEKGIYSPVQDCRMKTNDAPGFCPVCSKAIKNTIEFYTKTRSTL